MELITDRIGPKDLAMFTPLNNDYYDSFLYNFNDKKETKTVDFLVKFFKKTIPKLNYIIVLGDKDTDVFAIRLNTKMVLLGNDDTKRRYVSEIINCKNDVKLVGRVLAHVIKNVNSWIKKSELVFNFFNKISNVSDTMNISSYTRISLDIKATLYHVGEILTLTNCKPRYNVTFSVGLTDDADAHIIDVTFKDNDNHAFSSYFSIKNNIEDSDSSFNVCHSSFLLDIEHNEKELVRITTDTIIRFLERSIFSETSADNTTIAYKKYLFDKKII